MWEIYKVCYVYWNKCHETYKRTGEEKDKDAAEVTFMIGITEIIDILRPLFMVDVCQLCDRWLNKLKKKRECVSKSKKYNSERLSEEVRVKCE